MSGAIRSRMTYANVIATLAMVFAMTGGAYAAKKYLITSTKQIKPSVLSQLKGKAGSAGPPRAPLVLSVPPERRAPKAKTARRAKKALPVPMA